MMQQQVTISNIPSPIESKFSRKQAVVYIVPSVDDCLKLLPRQLGNHILSYTYALFDFYVENLVLKFGYKFVVTIFLEQILHITVRRLPEPKITMQDKLKQIMIYCKRLRVERQLIIGRFDLEIFYKKTMQEQKRQLKIHEAQKNEAFMQQITVGDIFYYDTLGYRNEYLLVCQKTKKTFYSIRVMITNETEQTYTVKAFVLRNTTIGYNPTTTITTDICYISQNITQMFLFNYLQIKPKKKLIFQSQNNNLTPTFVLNKTEKRKSVMTLFRLKSVNNSKSEYEPM